MNAELQQLLVEKLGLTPDQATLYFGDVSTDAPDGRSPFKPRQLHDLRLLPTAKDPRPTFFWSTEAPRDAPPYRPQAFPRLVWINGVEKCLKNQKDLDALNGAFEALPPNQAPVSPLEAMQTQIDMLSDEDRQLLEAAYAEDRRARLLKIMGGMSVETVEAALGAAKTQASKRPGRAKKAVNE